MQSPKLLKTTLFVVAAHVAVVGGIMLTSARNAKAKGIEEDKKALTESYKFVGVDDVPEFKPKPVATPVPSSTPKVEAKSVPTTIPKVVATPVPKEKAPSTSTSNDWPRPKLHVVSKGETFYGLAKKYHQNPKKFKQINHLKDEAKIFVGQKLILE